MTRIDGLQTDTTEDSAPSTGIAPRVVGGVVLVLIGVLWLLERTGVIDITLTAVLGLATMVVGIALMIMANRGSQGGLIVLGTILALVTLATATAPFEGFRGGVGDRMVQVSSAGDLSPEYNQAMGTLTIDLRDVDDFGPATSLEASVGLGELVVRVAPDTELSVEASVGAGEIDILGEISEGIGVDGSHQTPGYSPDKPGLVLELQSFAGTVEVTDD